MSTVTEYSYDYDEEGPYLNDHEAPDRYQYEKSLNQDALVIMESLHCGQHWRVRTYRTDAEKDAYLTDQVGRIWEQFIKKLSRK